jgi:3-mercaptopyruvate sulfurtransferase SseA
MLQSRPAVIAGLLWIATGAMGFAHPQLTPQPPAGEPAAPAAAQPAPAPQSMPADPLAAARRISAEEARQAVAKGEAVLVDVRGKESYDREHAKGALSIPLSDLSSRMGELPKDKLVITYCT